MSEQPGDGGSEPGTDLPSGAGTDATAGETVETVATDDVDAIPDARATDDAPAADSSAAAADSPTSPADSSAAAADSPAAPDASSSVDAADVLPSWDVDGATTDSFPDVAAEVAAYVGEDSSGHDLAHAWRVFDLGRSIASEEGADAEVVGLAALTHDLHRVVGDDGEEVGSEYVHPEATLEDVAEVLRDAGVEDAATIEAVQHCVAVHDDFAFRGDPDRVETIEAAVVRDADNLDALGAIGIGRTFTFGGDRGVPMWAPGAGGASTADEVEEVSAEGEAPSTLDHAYEKLLRLEEELHTDAAREIAEERMAFLEEFVERFEREWRGEL